MIKNAFEVVLQSSSMVTPHVLHMGFTRADNQPFNFIPGQFITFHIEHTEKTVHRSYSVASIAGRDPHLIEIAIAHYQGGIATEKLFHLQPGGSLTTTGPFGRLILREENVKRYILVATGTGVAPYRAMLPEIARRIEQDNLIVELILGVQGREFLLYGSDFLEYAAKHSNFKFHAYYSRQQPTDQQPYEHMGYVQESFDHLNLDPANDIIYLCGNPNMIDDSFALLQEQGFDVKNVRREKYISS